MLGCHRRWGCRSALRDAHSDVTAWFIHADLLAPDACRYEGLTREDAPQMKGVMVIGNGLGGGLQEAEKGDK